MVTDIYDIWQGTSRTKLYDELGWESLSDRRWVRRLTLFYKIQNGLATLYLSPHIPTRNEIDMPLRNRNSVFARRDKFGIKLLTKIRVNFSDLREHRFYHSFNCENPICSCGIEDEISVHFFLRCPHFTTQRSIFISKISDIIGSDVSVLPDEHLYSIIVYGSNVYNFAANCLIIIETISYIRKSGRFAKLEAFE